jgi:predicted ATPase
MKVRRVILEGVNNFIRRFDYSFEDEWTERVPDSLLLIGPNGSGKTTLLNVVAGLWELFGRWIEPSEEFRPTLPTLIPLNCRWAAMELIGLEKNRPLWIFYTPVVPEDWADLPWIIAQQETYRIGATLRDTQERSLLPQYFPPGAKRPLSHDPSDQWIWVDEWRQRFTENTLSKRNDLPNVLFIESDARALLEVEESFTVIREPEEFHWLARYEPTNRRKGSLENYLFNLSAVDRPAFDRLVDQANVFLINKKLTGFSQKTGDLMVWVIDGPGRHTINQLSSGEKQVLLLIAFITRRLRPGGIVLIDEPDLHLHVSWANALVDHLRRMVAEQKGQLIMASHAPELWGQFTQSHRVELGALTEIQR